MATIGGLRAFADGDRREAVECWLTAARLIERANATEPLLAASQNNAGAALLLISDASGALSCLARAHDLWARSREQIDTAEPELVSSSAFHIRLAMQHHETFASVRRSRYLDLCRAGVAIVAFNTTLATSHQPDACNTPDADQDIVAALASAFGANSAEVRMLLGASDDRKAAHRDKAARLADWPARSYLDVGQYLASVELAAHMSMLLPPSFGVAEAVMNENGSGDDD